MELASPLVTILPQLGIGALAIIGLVYVVFTNQSAMKELLTRNQHAMDEREREMRALEREVRSNIMNQLQENTQAFKQVLAHFNSHGR